MYDDTIYQFDELFTDHDGLDEASLIIGNGASIAVNSCFSYDSLYTKAIDEKILDDKMKELFAIFETEDFEFILDMLRNAFFVNSVLKSESECERIKEMYGLLRDALIKTVDKVHIKYNNAKEQIRKISNFISKFKIVISLNYDLLLYWGLMYNNNDTQTSCVEIKDCFLLPGNEVYSFDDFQDFTSSFDTNKLKRFDFNVSKYEKPIKKERVEFVFYPHGNLVLVTNKNKAEFKITAGGSRNLINAIENAWGHGYVPLFISEGDSTSKLNSIMRSSYLSFVYNYVLPNLASDIIVYGWSFNKQDEHLVNQIFYKKVPEACNIYVSIYKEGSHYRRKMREIHECITERNGKAIVKFFDSSSPGCWCN